MNVIFCVGLITISSMVAITLVMFIAWILSAGSDYLDSDDIAGAMGVFIGMFIIFGSILLTWFIDTPETFGYAKIETESVEVNEFMEHVDSSVVLEEE